MRYLGIDYGLKKTGIAIGDDETGLALPFDIVRGASDTSLIKHICAIVRKEHIDEIIVGIPQRSRKELPTIEPRIRVFAQKLGDVSRKHVRFASERWTSKVAQTLLDGAKDDDAVAAMLIVQSMLRANV